ncbi:MAG: hypothetical protein M5U31_15985 [Acidimicrobiia bacterium]|nr:hypothetical protein [Acidimicrobiia bacterium]
MNLPERRVTNPKIADLGPTWRRYAGVSLLFDNPGPLLGASGGTRGLSVPGPGDAPLLEALGDASDMLDAERLRARFGLCRLPPATYHVTVCDGVNQIQASGLRSRSAGAVQGLLRDLPLSLTELPASLDFLAGRELVDAVGGLRVAFVAAELVRWGSVLAVRLETASRDDEAALREIREERDAYASEIEARLGLRVQAWRPHVSLAYFADSGGADAAGSEISRWSDEVLGPVEEATVCFSSVSLYGFTDMVTFFKAA